MNLQNEIDAYLQYCENQKKLSAKTIKAYSIDLNQFVKYADAPNGREISKQILSNYISVLHKKHQPLTVKRKLASLRAFFNYLEFEEVLESNPIRKIKTKFQKPKTLPRTIPLKLIERLLTIVHGEKSKAKTKFALFTAQRDTAIVEMLFATGMRVSEICSLKTEDVNLDDGNIRIMGKGSKERIIQIGNKEVLSILHQYREGNLNQISKSDFFL